MKHATKLTLSLIFGLFLSGILCPTNNTSAWIGSGSGGSGGGGGGGGDYCSSSFTLDCAGVSWAFYKAQSTTDSWTDFPYFNSSWRVTGVSIPPECSQHEGGGFWHYGINLFGANLGDYDFNDAMYGHWVTMNYNNTPYWAPYNISDIPWGAQWVGVYKIDHFAWTEEALTAYQEAYLFDHPGASKPTSIPGDVWGFCYWPGMKEVTLTAKAIDTNGNSLSDRMADKTNKGQPGTEHSVTVGSITGYTKQYWGTDTSSSTWTSNTDMTYTEAISSDKTIYAVYNRNEFTGRARVQEGTSSWNSTSNKADSGYLRGENGGTSTLYMNCSNVSNCKAKFYFDLKNVAGSGATSWQIQKRSDTKDGLNSKGEAVYTWSNVSGASYHGPSTPSTSGTNVVSFEKTLRPNQVFCYRIVYAQYTDSEATNTQKNRYAYACAKANPVKFSGYSKVFLTDNTSTSASTGWKESGSVSKNPDENIAWLQLTNCNDGCKVTWQHGVKLTQGLSDSTSAWSLTIRGNATGTYPAESPQNHTETIRTGQAKCRTFTFNYYHGWNATDAELKTYNASTRACVYATGTIGSDIDIKAKKSTSSTWLEAPDSSPIWAKPTDIVNLKGTYSPKYQYVYGYKPTNIILTATGTNKITVDNSTDNNTIQSVFNAKIEPDWNNAFSVKLGGNSAAFDETSKSNTIGKTNSYSLSKNYTVDPRDAGRTITATALTNNMNNKTTGVTTKTTPKQATFTYTIGTGFTSTINHDAIKDNSVIKVPYNFINTTEVTFDDTNSVIYAGETKNIDFNIKTNPRKNTTTGGTYATKVDDAKWKLELCYNGNNCFWTPPVSGTLNSSGLLDGGEPTKKYSEINIPDINAGAQICLRSAVYPKDSGTNTNLAKDYYDPNNANSWAYSPKKCYTVAKKPSIQIWGGNAYTRGNITTSTMVKGNLAGYNNYGIKASYDKSIFGSWSELGLIISGSATGFSSGASLGYASINNGTLSPNPYNNVNNNNPLAPKPGGSTQTSLCNRSPLTFANYPCNGSSTNPGSLGNSTATNSIKNDKSSIVSKFIYGGDPNIADNNNVILNQPANIKKATATLADGSKANGEIYYYYSGNNNLIIPTNTINRGTIQIVHSDKNITINGNLTYDNANAYSSFEDMPKLVVYAEGNIYIGCGVTRIDAILIADSTVITCANNNGSIPGINTRERSNQLIVHGAIISNVLKPTRTYGAATGANSIVPAEIINFDPTLYLWGGEQSQTSTNDNTNLNASYLKDLPPRR